MFPIGVASFADLYTGEQLLLYILMSVANATLIFFASMKFILVLQQCGYHGKRYFKWLSNKDTPYMSRLMLLCMLALLFFCVLNMTFEPILGKDWGSYIGFRQQKRRFANKYSFYYYVYRYGKTHQRKSSA